MTVSLTPGQCHESKEFERVINQVRIVPSRGRPRTRPEGLAGDKAYSAQHIRQHLRDRKIKSVVPTRSNEQQDPGFDKGAYRKRNIVERCFGWLKESRRIATRYEK